MGKGSELLSLLKTGNSGEARKIIQKLKKQGKKKVLTVLNEQDDEGCTPLHYSAAYNFLEFIADFLELGAVVDVEDGKGFTPLHLAATNGRAEAVSVLLCRGADPDISARSGDTPIHLAAHNGHEDCVENLIREHAKCTMLNVSGQSPLDLACQNGHAQVVALLLRSGQFNPQRTETPQTSLKLAAKHGHTQVLSILIKHGFDVNRVLPGAHGTCLHEAALYGKIETVHYLLQCGANPSIKNTQGLTPLDIVNHYTDPRSAQQLKQLLKDALANQARIRMSQQYQLEHSQPQPYTYPQVHRQSHPQGYPQVQPQAQTHPQVQPQAQTHPQVQPQAQTHPQAQPQSHVMRQTSMHSMLYPPHSGGQTMVQKQMSVPVQQPHPTQVTQQPIQNTGPSMAEMIAAKAASRKPMTISPTKKELAEDRGVLLRSATLAGMQRPSIDRSLLQKRRNSYTEETGQEPVQYNRSNPPTLPRRAHPPTFKPVPPPASPSPDTEKPLVSPVVTDQTVPSITDVKLKKVTKQAPPPVEKEVTMESELLAKLRKRQETIDTAPPQPPESEGHVTTEVPQEPVQATPTTNQRVPQEKEESSVAKGSAPSSPSKPPPKPKPKPVTAKPVKKEEEPAPPPVLTWQEEIARRRPIKDESPEKTPPPLVKPKPSKESSPIHTHNSKVVPPVKTKPTTQRQQQTTQRQQQTTTTTNESTTPQAQLPTDVQKKRPSVTHPPTTSVTHPPTTSVTQPPTTSVTQPPTTSVTQLPTTSVEPSTRESNLPVEQPPVSMVTQVAKLNKPVSGPVVAAKEDNPVISKVVEDELSYRPSTPSSDQMSPSTSISSLTSVPLSTTPGLHTQYGFECVPIADWLTSYKLTEYIPLMQGAGYDNTDFLIGASVEELTEIGISKPGHRKRMMSALSQLIAKEHFLTFKPASVAEWLQQLGLSQYEGVMMDNGYDDIDFITSVTEEELLEIGITKKGHLKRFKKGIDELSDMLSSEPPTPSPYPSQFTSVGASVSPSHSTSNMSSTSQNYDRNSVVAENDANVKADKERTPPTTQPDKPLSGPIVSVSSSLDSGIETGTNDGSSKRQSVHFNKMKKMLAKRMGLGNGEADDDEEEDSENEEPSKAPPPPVQMRQQRPPPIPKRATSTALSQVTEQGIDSTDGSQMNNDAEFSTEDISSVLDTVTTPPYEPGDGTSRSSRISSTMPELDDLDKALQGFARMEEDALLEEQQKDEEMLRKFEEEAQKEMEDELKTDQMLADIDNMLADLNTHLDIMIPPSSTS